MHTQKKLQKKVTILLATAILTICIGFVLTGCLDSQVKSLLTDLANCAIDFTRRPGVDAYVYTVNGEWPSIAGTPLTLEAWVKSKADPQTGGIFSRFDTKGIAIHVKNNRVKFGLRILPMVTIAVPNPTSTMYFVDSGFDLANDDTWHHVAAVLTTESHSSLASGPGNEHPFCQKSDGTFETAGDLVSPPAFLPGGIKAEQPHMDFYVDGVLVACGTTWGGGDLDYDTATGPQFAQNPDVFFSDSGDADFGEMGVLNAPSSVQTPTDFYDGLQDNHQFEGSIDEVRLHDTAFSAAKVATCMSRQLSTGDTPCPNDSHVIGYWAFNVCQGEVATDFSGLGTDGSIESPATIPSDVLWTFDAAPVARE